MRVYILIQLCAFVLLYEIIPNHKKNKISFEFKPADKMFNASVKEQSRMIEGTTEIDK